MARGLRDIGIYLSITSVILALVCSSRCLADTAFPAIFVFGDSTADVGTNNWLPVRQARADFRFNGIDFIGSKPTGRFSNGFNIADSVARLFGFKRSPPAFLELLNNRTSYFKRNIQHGANFASGGAGLLPGTGSQFGKVISMDEQVQQFAEVCSNISEVLGAEAGESLIISKSLILVSIGSNDIFEYFELNVTTPPPQYIANLIQSYYTNLQKILELGARRLGIISTPPVGCIPQFRFTNTSGGCFDPMNLFSQMFFAELQVILEKLSSEHKGMVYSLGNSYAMTMDVLLNPFAFRFKNVKSACCGWGRLGAESGCLPNATVCDNRNDYFFWDRYHPSQIGSELAALTLYGSEPNFALPVNFSQLVVN